MSKFRYSPNLGALLGSAVLLAVAYHLFVFLFDCLKSLLLPFLL